LKHPVRRVGHRADPSGRRGGLPYKRSTIFCRYQFPKGLRSLGLLRRSRRRG